MKRIGLIIAALALLVGNAFAGSTIYNLPDSTGHLTRNHLLPVDNGTITEKASIGQILGLLPVSKSVIKDGSGNYTLSGDAASPAAGYFYGTDSGGAKGFQPYLDILDARSFGTAKNSATLIAALSAIASGGVDRVLYVPSGFSVDTDVTFGAHVKVWAAPGAFTKSGGKIKFNAPLEAGDYQIFSGFGSSDISFDNNSMQPYVAPSWWGASHAASRADNTAAFQAALNVVKAAGAKLRVENNVYPMATGITLLETVAGASVQTWVLDFGGATLSWVGSGLTTGSLFKVGADSGDHMHEGGFTVVKNLKIIGPEPDAPRSIVTAPETPPHFPTADGNTIGLHVANALDITLESVFVSNAYKGVYVENTYPINAREVNARSNYIGMHLGSTVTLGTWTGCSVNQTAYGLVLQPDHDDDVIDGQTFVGLRIENTLRGITLDPRAGSGKAAIRHITFINPRFEAISYDLLRAGREWVFLQPDNTAATSRANFVQAVNIYGGEWEDPLLSGSKIRVGTSNCKGWDVAAPLGLYSQVAGSLLTSRLFIQPDLNGGTNAGTNYVYGPLDFSNVASASSGTSIGTRQLKDYEMGTWTPAYVPETNSFTSITYSLQSGSYVKVGKLVLITGIIRTSAITVGSATNAIRIGGLPYNSEVETAVTLSDVEGFPSNHPSAAFIRPTSRLISLQYRTAANGATTNLQVSGLGTGASANEVHFSATYITGD